MTSSRPPLKALREAERDDDGSVVVEFVLVSVLVVFLATAILQLALTLHVRNTLASCAGEGARLAARHDRTEAEGADRSEWLIGQALGHYPHTIRADTIVVDGAPVVEVEVSAPVPVLGLWGVGDMSVTAHALEEGDRDG